MLRVHPLSPGVTGREIYFMIATWGQSGRLSPAPGTWGSLAALPFCLFIKWLGGDMALALFAFCGFMAGLWAVKQYARAMESHDPGEIVIDEVVGVAITYLFVPAHSFFFICLGFMMFRLFDAVKVGPVGWCDRSINGPLGVMIDDIVAGLLAGGFICLIRLLML